MPPASLFGALATPADDAQTSKRHETIIVVAAKIAVVLGGSSTDERAGLFRSELFSTGSRSNCGLRLQRNPGWASFFPRYFVAPTRTLAKLDADYVRRDLASRLGGIRSGRRAAPGVRLPSHALDPLQAGAPLVSRTPSHTGGTRRSATCRWA